MKRFVPIKYIFGMIALFFLLPLFLAFFITLVFGFNHYTITVTIFLVAVVISGPFVYIWNLGAASIIIEDGRLHNYIIDGTMNNGWIEDIKDIKTIEVTSCEKAQKYYKNCKAKKVLLIDFGAYNVKYIAVTLFTKRQIAQILKEIEKHNQVGG